MQNYFFFPLKEDAIKDDYNSVSSTSRSFKIRSVTPKKRPETALPKNRSPSPEPPPGREATQRTRPKPSSARVIKRSSTKIDLTSEKKSFPVNEVNTSISKPVFETMEQFFQYYLLDQSFSRQHNLINEVSEVYQKEKGRFEQIISEQEEKFNKVMSKSRHLSKEVARLMQEIEAKDGDLQKMQEKIDENFNKYEEENQKNLILEIENNQFKQEIKELTKTKENLQHSLNEKEIENKSLNAKLEQSYLKIETLEKEVNSFRPKITKLESSNQQLRAELQDQGIKLINMFIYPQLDKAKTFDEYISILQSYADLCIPTKKTLEESEGILHFLRDEVAEVKGFTKPEHSLVALDSYAKAFKVKAYIDNRFDRSQDPALLFQKIVLEIDKKILEGITNEQKKIELLLSSLAKSLKKEVSALIIIKTKATENKYKYWILDKSDLYLTKFSEKLVKNNHRTAEIFETEFNIHEINPDDIKISRQPFFKYLQINTDLFFHEIKKYMPDDHHPICKKNGRVHFKHFGFDGFKFNTDLQYPGTNEFIKWSKAYFSPLANESHRNRKEILTNIYNTSTSNSILECMEYASEAEAVTVPVKFEHENSSFYFVMLFQVRIDQQNSKKIDVIDPFCFTHIHKTFLVDGFYHLKNVRMIIKKVEDDHKLLHNNDCYLCNHKLFE